MKLHELIMVLAALLLIVTMLLLAPKAQALGTGFFISNNGYLLTNRHVVDLGHKDPAIGTNYRYVRHNNHTYLARIIKTGKDLGIDLVLLKIEAPTPCLPVGYLDNKDPAGMTVSVVFQDRRGKEGYYGAEGLDIVVEAAKVIGKTFIPLNGGYTSTILFEPNLIRPGNSGSPIISNKHQIVFVVNSGAQSLFGGIDNDELIRFMQSVPTADPIVCYRPTANVKSIINNVY